MFESFAEFVGEVGDFVCDYLLVMLEIFKVLFMELLEWCVEWNKCVGMDDFDEEEMYALEEE